MHKTQPIEPPGVLGPDLGDSEPPGWRRWVFLALAVWVVVFSAIAHRYWVPAHGGTDQNAYLVGAKLLARSGSPRLVPRDPADQVFDPFQYVGSMWVGVEVGTEGEHYYPKYPGGTWLIQAGVVKAAGPMAVYLISPIAMALTLVFGFLIIRIFAGSLPALLGTLVLPLSPAILEMTNSPNSHALSLAIVTAGMFSLMRWIRRWQPGWGWAAGLLLGYSATIRYTNGLLLVPLLAAMLFTHHGEPTVPSLTKWKHRLPPLFGWGLPVAVMILFNLSSLGTITGYAASGESAAFAWGNIIKNWEGYGRLLVGEAPALVLPLGVAGLFVLLIRRRVGGLILASWGLPMGVTYLAYYFEPNLRFILPVVPVLVLCSVWLLSWLWWTVEAWALQRGGRNAAGAWWVPVGIALSIGAMLIVPSAVRLRRNLSGIEGDYREWSNVLTRAEVISAVAPTGSLLFVDEPYMAHNLSNHLQYVGDYRIYRDQAFEPYQAYDPEASDPWTAAELVESRYRMLGGMSKTALQEARQNLIRSAASAGRRCFIFSSIPEEGVVLQAYGESGFRLTRQRSHLDPFPTSGHRLQDAGWRDHRGERREWFVYEIEPQSGAPIPGETWSVPETP